jgi:hypothetical protein
VLKLAGIVKCAVGEVGLGVECRHGEPCLFEAEAVGVGRSSKGEEDVAFLG